MDYKGLRQMMHAIRLGMLVSIYKEEVSEPKISSISLATVFESILFVIFVKDIK